MFPTSIGVQQVFAASTSYGLPKPQVRNSRSFHRLQDVDLMPFGPHRGTRMMDVPASYLDILRDAKWLESSYPAVADYIERAAKAIDQDLARADSLHSTPDTTSENPTTDSSDT